MTIAAVVAEGLGKRFGSFVAVDQVSFEVPEGEVFGCLGPNGAGKTTLMRMLVTLLPPSQGQARVAGFDVVRAPGQVRQNIGVIPQAMTSDLDLTAYENMDIYARFYGMPAEQRRPRIAHLLEMVGLASRAHDLVASYSGGMRRRLEVARGMVHRPRVLFLDEPSAGLDPQSRRALWELLRQIRAEQSTTVFLMTHYMEEADALCGRVAIVDAGRIVALGAPAALKRQIPGNDRVTLTLDRIPAGLADALRGLPGVHRVHVEHDEVHAYVDAGPAALPALMDAARAAGAQVRAASLHEQSLEDVFIHFTGKSIRDSEARKVSLLAGGMPRRWGA